ncbi:hypothetical protein GJ744_011086 [Endocarpon pusillum]|uniref:Uncharacterized protein n=1 Tax=Endocarpon pusillum TaxID=364733 RepID=A0A8H7AD70_9EURO|nr:hypothetical protein GJ744_011086 [Endocarpon pusillum]
MDATRASSHSSFREPEAVVGIDFGTTCTGVGYSIGPTWPPPKCIQKWPSRVVNPFAFKVPSRVGYRSGRRPKTWGFLCNPDEEDVQIEEHFKMYLNPRFDDHYGGRQTHHEARTYFKDFLRCIYNFIVGYFLDTVPRWADIRVEYLFSIPTDWLAPELSAEFEKLVKEAGFGRDASRERVRIAMTEAEAAAVCAATHHYAVDDVILVCDAGGATSDLNILKVKNAGHTTELGALNHAEGINVGSALIDWDLEMLIRERLAAVPALGGERERGVMARTMVRGDQFQVAKHAFGSEGAVWPTIPLSIPGLDKRTCGPDILNGELSIRREELQRLFDIQVEKLFTVIDEQLMTLENNWPNEQISYFVLSGGLGCSPYVQNKIKSRYITASQARNASNPLLMLAAEPQLAVAQGLVMDRIQFISRGRNVYQDRRCRTSFGVLVNKPYDEHKHRGEPVRIDPLDKKKWAQNQIEWLIKKGKRIPNDGIRKVYQHKIPLDNEDEVWQAEIVVSSSGRPPSSMRGDNVRTVCTVDATFPWKTLRRVLKGRKIDGIKLMTTSWWKKDPQYILVEFELCVLVGSADVKFLLKTRDGKIFSHDHVHVEINWEQEPRPAIGHGKKPLEYPRRQRS